MKNRILAMLLALVLTLSLLPAGPTARAADDRPYGETRAADDRPYGDTRATDDRPYGDTRAADDRPYNESVTDSAVTVTFDLNGYGSDGPAPQSVTAGTPAADPGYSAVIDGMLFDGWYTEPECENPYDFAAPVSADLKLYASFVRCHTIHFDPNGATMGEMPDVIVKHGDTFVLPVCEFRLLGKTLYKWDVTGLPELQEIGTILPVFRDLTIQPAWTSAVVTFSSNGGTGYMQPIYSSDDNGYIKLPECSFTPPTGFRFKKWSHGNPGEAIPIYDHEEISAVWEAIPCTITYISSGDGGEMPQTTLNYGSNFIFPACTFTPPTGMKFCKWAASEPDGDPAFYYTGQIIPVKTDLSLTPQWMDEDAETCIIGFTPNGGSGEMSDLVVEKGISFVAPSCAFSPPQNKEFYRWELSTGKSAVPGASISITTDTTFRARWKNGSYYTVSFDVQGHGTTPEPQKVSPGACVIRPEDPYEEGCLFMGWFLHPVGIPAYNFSEPVHWSFTIYGQWTLIRYCLLAESGSHGTVILNTDSAVIDDEITVTAKPDEGYAVDRIIYTPAGGAAVDITAAYDPATGTASFNMPPANVAVAVFFKPVEPVLYPVSLEIVGDGTAALSKNSAEAWDRVTVQAAPAEGWSLERVLLIAQDGTEREITERMGFNMPEGPATVRVEFRAEPHSVTLDLGPGGKAVLSAQTAATGEEVSVTATPARGYRLQSIRVVPVNTLPEGGEPMDITDSGKFIMPAWDVKVELRFEALSSRALRLETQGSGSASLSVTPADETAPNSVILSAAQRSRRIRPSGADKHGLSLQPQMALARDTRAADDRPYEETRAADDRPYEETRAANDRPYEETRAADDRPYADESVAYAGDRVTVTATPEPGWRLDSVSYVPTGGEAVDITQDLAFVMPEADVTVRVVFAELEGYAVELDLGQGGTAALSTRDAKAGETVTVTINADGAHGWELDSIVWQAEGGEVHDITEAKQFSMPAEAVTVKVSFRRINPFEDNIKGKYYYNSVLWAYWHDPRVTSGTDDTHFSPNKDCTREQIVTFLYAAYGKPGHEETESPFTDVTPKKYYYHAVMWAVENGITGGVGDGKFGVGKPCTREQVVTFLWKAAGAPAPQTDSCPFEDVKPGKYYYKAVLWALENGVTGGMSATSFGVGKTCTRAQVVTFLYKAVGENE